MDDLFPFLGRDYLYLLGALFFGRTMDFLSTWIATPNLILEANPLARRLGWKLSLLLNFGLCFAFALWPLPGIVIVTTSLLVAARNLQSAWLMRSFGENRYRAFMAERFAETHYGLYLICVLGQSLMVALLGSGLMYFSGFALIPFAVGMGLNTYAVAISVYTLNYSRLWSRIRRPTALKIEE